MSFRLVKLLDPLYITANVEFQSTATHLQWRLIGGEWADLVALSEITGPAGADGKEVELQVNSTHIQWRLTGETWEDLIALTEITGPQGDTGADGANAYVYIAYASDDIGTDFTLTFDSSLSYIAILSTATAIPSPIASDFTGLWKNYGGGSECLKLDQTTPQTITGGIPLLDSGRVIDSDNQLVDKEYVDASLTVVDEYADLASLDSSITKAIVRYDTLASRSYTTLDGNTLYDRLYINPLPPLYSADYSDSYIMYSGQLLTLDTAATPADFAVGATITGASSGTSAKIGAKLTSLTYTIIKPTGSFTDGETLSDGTNSADQGTGYPTLGYNVVNGALEASEDAGFRLWTVQLTGFYLSADAIMAVQQNYIGDAFEISFDGKSYLRISGGWIDNLAYVDPDTGEVFAVTMYDKKADTVSAFGPSYIVPASDDAANWHRIKYALQPTEFSINYSGVYQKIADVWTLIIKNDKLDNANIGVPVP